MLNNVRSKQTFLIAAIVLLVGFLFSRDVKGLVTSSSGKGTPGSAAAEVPVSTLSLEEVSATGKNLLSESLSKEISGLESDYQTAKGAERLDYAKRLSDKWDDVEQAVPSALYAELVAQTESTLTNWLTAGNRFLKAFDNSQQDSLIQPVMLQKANAAFKNALAKDSVNSEAKTGLGITIVNGMGAPMEGIALLREVVAKDPKNFKANMNLGTFAMKSGQFDKAVLRFKDIIANIKATPDAYFYLATAHENLGQNEEAIAAYLSSKKLAANQTLSKFIDEKVAELKKK